MKIIIVLVDFKIKDLTCSVTRACALLNNSKDLPERYFDMAVLNTLVRCVKILENGMSIVFMHAASNCLPPQIFVPF